MRRSAEIVPIGWASQEDLPGALPARCVVRAPVRFRTLRERRAVRSRRVPIPPAFCFEGASERAGFTGD